MKHAIIFLVLIVAGALLSAQTLDHGLAASNAKAAIPRYPAVDPDAYENDDTANTAQLIQIYPTLHTQNHTIDSPPPAVDLDWFRFYGESGKIYFFWSTGSTNTGIGLYQDNGTTQIDTDDDSGDGNNFFLQFEPATSAYYKLVVSGYAAGAYVFCYLYTNPDLYEPDNLPTQYTDLALTPSLQSQSHTLHSLSDADWFGFQAEEGKFSAFYTTGFTNTCAWIYAGDGTTLLATAEGGGTGSNFDLQFFPTYTGFHLLKIGSNSSPQVGPYLLYYRWGMLPDAYEPDNTAAQAYPLDILPAEQFQPRNLQDDSDQDWCAFEAEAGYTYSFWSTGPTDTQISLYDESGTTLIDSNDNDGEGSNFLLHYAAMTTANLKLVIDGVSGSAGPYWFYFVRARTWGNDWIWAANVPNGGSVEASAIDPVSGCIYLTGYFEGSAVFGPYTLTSSGWGDIFAAKLDPNGNWLWAVRAGGWYSDRGLDLTVTPNGNNIYVCGHFAGSADFGPYSLNTDGSWDSDVFVAKLDSSGNWLWAVQAGGDNYDDAKTLCLGAGGDIFIAGVCSSGAYFGPAYMAYGCKYIAKLFPDGSWFGAAPVQGSYDFDDDMSLCAGPDGCFYLAGPYHNTAQFGQNITLTSTATGKDTFVAKFDANGYWQWAADSDALGTCLPKDICFQGDDCYLTGCYEGTVYFGSCPPLTYNLSSDVFVAKIDSSGNWIWAISGGGDDADIGNAICANSNGVVVTGAFTGTTQFGEFSLASAGSTDIFAAKIDTSGNWIWTTQAGGTGADQATAISFHPQSGKLSVAGKHTQTCDFDAFSVTGNGIFVAQLNDFASLPGTPRAPENLNISWYSVFDPWTHTTYIYEKVTWSPVILDTNGVPLVPSYYEVYYAEEPYGTFSLLGNAVSCEFSRLLGTVHMDMPPKGFYYIKAVAL